MIFLVTKINNNQMFKCFSFIFCMMAALTVSLFSIWRFFIHSLWKYNIEIIYLLSLSSYNYSMVFVIYLFHKFYRFQKTCNQLIDIKHYKFE